MSKPTTCELCEREIFLTFHHLVPKKTHKRNYVRKQFKDINLNEYGIYICRDCHSMIHKKITHSELARKYYTKKKLLQNPTISEFVNWVKKQRKRAKR